jgi:hypothetical protein
LRLESENCDGPNGSDFSLAKTWTFRKIEWSLNRTPVDLFHDF